ncbi:MAG: GWxTD domain-containing protein [bacterium]
MKILLVNFLSFLFLIPPVFGQAPIYAPEGKAIDFNIDYASFKHKDGNIYLEVYYSFYHRQLEFVDQDSHKVATFNVDVKILQEDSLLDSRIWYGKTILDKNRRHTQDEMIFTLSKFILSAGQYQYVTKIKDTNSKVEGFQEITLDLPGFAEDKLSMSDIELATSIAQDSSQNIFTKNRYQIIPHPSALFSPQNPMLYFYTEIYNLSNQLDSTYSVEYSVMNSDGTELRSYPPKKRKHPGTSVVEIGGINVIAFPTGTYFLQLKVRDTSNGSEFIREKKFFTFRGRDTDKSLAVKTNTYKLSHLYEEYKHKSADEIDEEFYSAGYLATREEKKIYASLDLAGKRDFMPEFWSKTDIHSGKNRYALKEMHLRRLNYAKNHFEGLKKGWQTDRGRVVMKYGEPDNVEKNFSLSGKRGYEIWYYYNQEGGLIFVFVDKGGFGDLELVHSNARTEINDLDWQRWIEQ